MNTGKVVGAVSFAIGTVLGVVSAQQYSLRRMANQTRAKVAELRQIEERLDQLIMLGGGSHDQEMIDAVNRQAQLRKELKKVADIACGTVKTLGIDSDTVEFEIHEALEI